MGTATAMHQQDLDDLFGILGQNYDLRAGTVRTPQDEREIYLPSDLLAGVHAALQFEAGEAWGIVLQTCGRTWGQRVAKRMWAQLASQKGIAAEDLPVDAFITWVEGWFRYCGWGVVTFDLAHATAHGVVLVRLEHSLYRESITEAPRRCDYLIAGLLSSLMARIADQPLGCAELGPDGQRALFAVTHQDRIDALQDALDDDAPIDDLMSQLLA